MLDDADPQKVADAVAVTGFANAGRVYISSQRILATPRIHDDLLEALTARSANSPPATNSTSKRTLARSSVNRTHSASRSGGQAQRDRAELRYDGKRNGAVIQPAVLPTSAVTADELRGIVRPDRRRDPRGEYR